MAHSRALDEWKRVAGRVDLREVLAPHLRKFKRGNPASAACPFHDDQGRPNLAIYVDNYRCFSCDAHGDLVDWYKSAPGGGLPFHDAVHAALRDAGVTLIESGGDRPTAPRATPQATTTSTKPAAKAPGENNQSAAALNLESLVSRAYEALQAGQDDLAQRARAYVADRGLADVADRLGFGVVNDAVAATLDPAHRRKFHGRLLIPFYQGGRVAYVKARALLGQEPKYHQPSGAIPGPWNVGAIERAKDVPGKSIIVTEGELDAASLLVALGVDAPVIGLPGGNLKDEWAEQLVGLTVYVLMDPDTAGQAHAAKVLDTLAGLGIRARAITWRADDVNAYLVAHGAAALRAELDELTDEADKLAVSDLGYIRSGFLLEVAERAACDHPTFPTGLGEYDKLLGGGYGENQAGGFVAGLHIVGGVPGVGKTALMLQVAVNNARAGRPVLYLSYEQPKFELWARIAGQLTGVPPIAFKTGRYKYRADGGPGEMPTADYLRRNHQAELAQLEQLAGHLRIVEGNAESGRWTVPIIKAEAEALRDAYGAPPLVICDYLQRMPVEERHEKREIRERVAAVALALQVSVARELTCPVLALSSLGRAAYRITGREAPEDLLSVFKEAGEIEFTAYTATVIYRVGEDEQAEAGVMPSKFTAAPDFVPLGFWVVKNREGETGKAFVKFYPRRGLMVDNGPAATATPAARPAGGSSRGAAKKAGTRFPGLDSLREVYPEGWKPGDLVELVPASEDD